MKRVDAAGAVGGEESDPRGRGQGHAAGRQRDVGHVIGNQPLAASHDLALVQGGVKLHQAVGGGDVGGTVLGVMNNAVDAEDVLILDVDGTLAGGSQNIKAMVEVADPKTAGGVEIECGDIPVRQ